MNERSFIVKRLYFPRVAHASRVLVGVPPKQSFPFVLAGEEPRAPNSGEQRLPARRSRQFAANRVMVRRRVAPGIRPAAECYRLAACAPRKQRPRVARHTIHDAIYLCREHSQVAL